MQQGSQTTVECARLETNPRQSGCAGLPHVMLEGAWLLGWRQQHWAMEYGQGLIVFSPRPGVDDCHEMGGIIAISNECLDFFMFHREQIVLFDGRIAPR